MLAAQRRRILRSILPPCGILLWCSHAALTASVEKKSFTVIDSIKWTRVLNLDGDESPNPATGTALFSPDGKQFVIHTRRGDIRKNSNIESLLLFKTADVDAFLASTNGPTSPNVVVQREVNTESGSIRLVQWLSNTEIGFIAEGSRHQNQAFAVNTNTTKTQQLSESSMPVTSFAAVGDRIVFYARSALESPLLMDSVGDKMLGEVIGPSDPESAPLELFQASRASGVVTRIAAPKMALMEHFQRIWLSPSGNYAVIYMPAANAPLHWSEYRIPSYELFGYTPDRISTDPTSPQLLFRTRYALVDFKNDTIRPLLDAPSGWLAQNGSPTEIFWAHAETTVIVSNAYLPLRGTTGAVREQRRAAPAVAEVDLSSDRVTPIMWEPVLADEARRTGQRLAWRIAALNWNPRDQTLEIVRRVRRQKGGPVTFERENFRKSGRAWRPVQVKGDAAASAGTSVLSINLRQSLSERPKIYASRAGVTKALFDPNPQAEMLQFGLAEQIVWNDAERKVEWRGGLVYPPHFSRDRRYPLVVQTHGFNADEFLVDGPDGITTSMAAQALANAGFIVLQVPDKPFTGDETEGQLFADGISAGIQHLISLGLVDPDKVGLIAFSRTGFHAIHLLARCPDLLAAITISDSVQIGYFNHVLLTNAQADLTTQLELLSGGAPQLDEIAEWFNRNPTYRLPRISTAVRLEANDNVGSVLSLWETYAVLRRAKRPVDLVYFREGSHVQTRPLERLGSQGGTVDWFRFWLQAHEDPIATKVEQYRRWRQLLELRDATKEMRRARTSNF